MIEKFYIRILVVFLLFVLASQVQAQQEQWLQYHSAREVHLIGSSFGYKNLEIITEKPAEVDLPQFKGQKQLFAKWTTPMVNDGYLWIALDRTHKQGPYDSLYIDSNGNGSLDDETASAAYRMNQRSAYFGPVKVIFEFEDGPVTYHLNFRAYQYNNSDNRLYASSGGWYEGNITVAGEKKHCLLFDNNANGLFVINPEKSVTSLPVGKYRIYDWTMERQDETGTNWKLHGSGSEDKNGFDVTENEQAVLSIGEPVIATLEAVERQGTYSFRHGMKGRSGKRIRLTRNGALPRAPKVHVKNADGAYDRTYSFQYR